MKRQYTISMFDISMTVEVDLQVITLDLLKTQLNNFFVSENEVPESLEDNMNMFLKRLAYAIWIDYKGENLEYYRSKFNEEGFPNIDGSYGVTLIDIDHLLPSIDDMYVDVAN